ncbi:MAG: hypothetical protein QXO67_01030, partial [Candidatus Bathyarchaeia archaeon]
MEGRLEVVVGPVFRMVKSVVSQRVGQLGGDLFDLRLVPLYEVEGCRSVVIGLVGLVGMESEREVVVKFLREGRLVVVGLEGFPVGGWGEWYLGQADEVRRVGWRCG